MKPRKSRAKTAAKAARKIARHVRAKPRERLRLLADIGGTGARFALQRPGRPPGAMATLAVADFKTIDGAVAQFLSSRGAARPSEAAFAVAAVADGDTIELTNAHWRFSAKALKRRLGLARIDVVNDFAALARSLPLLKGRDLLKIGAGARVAGAPMIVLGPGTGLGVAGLVPAADGPVAVSGQGGHATLAAANEREEAVIAALRRRFGHVSAERAISGSGLVNLFTAICEIEGEEVPRATAEGIARRALDGSSAFCAEALEMLCAMLGTVAGDVALAYGARGGVFIGGGILRRHRDYFARSPFRARFEAKGRYSGYLAAMPTYLILRENAALIGLGAMRDDAETSAS
jgi:glucokinase